MAQRLVESSFADTVFFCNSGAEAMECAIKVARKYHAESGHPERYRLVACTGSFHGRTLATLAAAGNEKYLKGFGPPAPGFDHIAFGNLNEMRAKLGPETAGVIVEPVQGEGMGRTGRLFAHEWAGVTPDVMALAKGLAGGFPVGACLATEKAAKGMTAGSHGSTFGGNPLAMAVANEVLSIMQEPGFFPRVERVAAALRKRLDGLAKSYPKLFVEARGKGLLVGFKCAVANTDVVDRLRHAGLLTVAAGENVVRLLPPLIIEESHVEEAAGIIDSVAKAWKP
jgi:acetylornithine/N-succinyldiaminopimelate aminotransferase